MPSQISSPQNNRIKDVLKLSKRRRRDERRLTVVEGVREVGRARRLGIAPQEIFLCPELIAGAEAEQLAAELYQVDTDRTAQLFEVTPEVFGRIAYRAESGGIVATIPYINRMLSEMPLTARPFLAVVEGVEKPGNLGAILRTADGAGVDGVIVCHAPGQATTDVHNPNVVRASLGTLFSVPVIETTSKNASSWLHENNIATIAATPNAKSSYTDVDLCGAIAIVMGSEAHGLSDFWLDSTKLQVSIPMNGIADSLNLSTSTALILYEAVRQRTSNAWTP